MIKYILLAYYLVIIAHRAHRVKIQHHMTTYMHMSPSHTVTHWVTHTMKINMNYPSYLTVICFFPDLLAVHFYVGFCEYWLLMMWALWAWLAHKDFGWLLTMWISLAWFFAGGHDLWCWSHTVRWVSIHRSRLCWKHRWRIQDHMVTTISHPECRADWRCHSEVACYQGKLHPWDVWVLVAKPIDFWRGFGVSRFV